MSFGPGFFQEKTRKKMKKVKKDGRGAVSPRLFRSSLLTPFTCHLRAMGDIEDLALLAAKSLADT